MRPTSLVAVPTLAPQCEGEQHPLGTFGHDHGPARFRVTSHCPTCAFKDQRNLCAGRVDDMLRRDGIACPDCETIHTRDSYVTVEALAAVPPKPHLALVDSKPDHIEGFALYQRSVNLSETTIRNRACILGALERHAQRELTDLSIDDLRKYIGRPGIKAGSRRTERGAIVAFYSYLEAEGGRLDNPGSRLAPITAPRGEPRPFTSEQVDAMLTSGAYTKTRAMILLGYYQGFRVSSIARVHGRDFDLDANTIRTTGKGGKQRTLPLHPVIAELALTMPRDGYWFPARKAPGQPCSSTSVTNLITLAKKRAGITDPTLTPHSLRHSFGTDLIEGGVDLRVIQELMMHSSATTTQIYTGVSASMKTLGIARLRTRPIPKQSGRRSARNDTPE